MWKKGKKQKSEFDTFRGMNKNLKEIEYQKISRKETTKETEDVTQHMEESPFEIFTSDTIKILACITMLIDHMAIFLVGQEQNPGLYLLMRLIGRLSFPLFAFLIVQGFMHTRNVRNYILRILAFAVVTEVIYDYAFFGEYVYVGKQNALFTLVIGLLALTGMRHFKDKTGATIGFGLLACAVALFLNSDFTFYGVLMIIFFYFDQFDRIGRIFSILLLNIIMGGLQPAASFALIFTEMYKERERKLPKYCFYVFYPLHLLILALLRNYV